MWVVEPARTCTGLFTHLLLLVVCISLLATLACADHHTKLSDTWKEDAMYCGKHDHAHNLPLPQLTRCQHSCLRQHHPTDLTAFPSHSLTPVCAQTTTRG